MICFKESVSSFIFINSQLRKIRASSSTIDCYNDKYVGIFPQMFLNPEMFLSIQDTRILMFFQLCVIITFMGFKITFSNIRSHIAPLLISRRWQLAPLPPGFSQRSQTLGLKGLSLIFSLEYFIIPVDSIDIITIAYSKRKRTN